MTGIRQRLREATHPLHARLERTMGLDRPTLDIERYGRALQTLHAVRSGWDPCLATILNVAPGPHCAWLQADLHDLGLPPRPPAMPPQFRLEPEAWGAQYVLEGSALGGRALLALVRPLGLTPEHGARYFAGFGGETGARWAAFLARLTQVADAEAAPDVVKGAIAAFDTLERFAATTMANLPDPVSSLR